MKELLDERILQIYISKCKSYLIFVTELESFVYSLDSSEFSQFNINNLDCLITTEEKDNVIIAVEIKKYPTYCGYSKKSVVIQKCYSWEECEKCLNIFNDNIKDKWEIYGFILTTNSGFSCIEYITKENGGLVVCWYENSAKLIKENENITKISLNYNLYDVVEIEQYTTNHILKMR